MCVGRKMYLGLLGWFSQLPKQSKARVVFTILICAVMASFAISELKGRRDSGQRGSRWARPGGGSPKHSLNITAKLGDVYRRTRENIAIYSPAPEVERFLALHTRPEIFRLDNIPTIPKGPRAQQVSLEPCARSRRKLEVSYLVIWELIHRKVGEHTKRWSRAGIFPCSRKSNSALSANKAGNPNIFPGYHQGGIDASKIEKGSLNGLQGLTTYLIGILSERRVVDRCPKRREGGQKQKPLNQEGLPIVSIGAFLLGCLLAYPSVARLSDNAKCNLWAWTTILIFSGLMWGWGVYLFMGWLD